MSMKEDERKVDNAFKKFGVKPRIFHFISDTIVYPYRAITIVTTAKFTTYEITLRFVTRSIEDTRFEHKRSKTTSLKHRLNANSRGAAICDKRDYFSRQRGRIIAKGRLLKQLKEEEK